MTLYAKNRIKHTDDDGNQVIVEPGEEVSTKSFTKAQLEALVESDSVTNNKDEVRLPAGEQEDEPDRSEQNQRLLASVEAANEKEAARVQQASGEKDAQKTKPAPQE
jgi:hypothetical protein